MIMLYLRLESLDLTEATVRIAISSRTLPPDSKESWHKAMWFYGSACFGDIPVLIRKVAGLRPHPRLHVDQRARAWFDGGKGDLHCKQTKRTLCGVFFFWCLVGDVLRAASLRTPNHNSWLSKQVLRISTKLWWSKFQAFPLLPYCSHHHLPVSTHPIRGTSGEVECYSLQA